jgi:hypothetical protein
VRNVSFMSGCDQSIECIDYEPTAILKSCINSVLQIIMITITLVVITPYKYTLDSGNYLWEFKKLIL